ncbi:Endonuclease 8 [Acaryochloris thomasi RCC1774]|uniref:DNA-(apurinic or apyrimidinic site) lyase n=1 Tax=Acaryochloris thomasi RCC1774 TaxID=1764569 RepID=A0A2W1JU10_9CYAN|nr:endonuclease VIII [Acaryochloris thomasi]PZD72077.1 Endonuclease 8 [Acaryochloris thomasi RCC1774]
MPEGPEIRRAADRIAAAVVQQPLQEVWFAFAHLQSYGAALSESRVTAVQTHGKAMLTRFSNGLSIYSHNQLYGKWMVRKAYSYPQTNRQLRLAIHCDRKSALLYSASDIEILDDDTILAHPFLSRIGPDVLSDQLSIEDVEQRFQDPTFHRRRLTTLLLDQHFFAGLGNYLRSEILFVARVHPQLRPIDCTSSQIHNLSAAVLSVTQQSYQTGGITNNIKQAEQLKASGMARRHYRHWVFSRARQPCFICQTPVIKELSSGRRYYYCPQCQQK